MFYKLNPIFKETIWGGNKLKKSFNKKYENDIISESWEFSLNNDGLSYINFNNSDILLKDGLNQINKGKNVTKDPEILIKLIDADDDLSIQVHPSDQYALKNYGSLGKTEMWYIIDKEENSFIYLGFNNNYSKEEVENALKEGTITSLLNKVYVEKGKFYLIPSGTIHAIGKGITLYEIQENSNITFRLFDYNRLDKNGNKRELHIEEALNVLNYNQFTKIEGLEKGIHPTMYFEIQKYVVKDNWEFKNNDNSLAVLTCTRGYINLDNLTVNQGDSYLVEASTKINMSGNGEFLIARIPDYGIGLDVGGTSVKGAIIDDLGHKISDTKVVNEYPLDNDKITQNMETAYYNLINKIDFEHGFFKSIGVGFPGNINPSDGIVKFSNNLGLRDYHLKDELSKKLDMEVLVDNDANCAALGEYYYTNAKRFHDLTLITLGTGVGGGVIIDSKLFRGGQGSVTELGHMKVKSDNFKCTCGQYGCLEALLSLARVKRDTLELIKDESNGLKDLINEEDNPVKIFLLQDQNEAARKYVDKFLNNLLQGLINICNLYQPQVIVLGGGVSNRIEKDIPMLEYKMNKFKFNGFDAPKVRLQMAQLNNDAGSYGAAALTKM